MKKMKKKENQRLLTHSLIFDKQTLTLISQMVIIIKLN